MNESSSIQLPNHAAVEIMGLAPRLRDDLAISVQVYGGETCYLLEDRISSRFFRVDLAAYTLISMLDGRTTIAEAVGRTASIMGPQALSEHDAAALCKWLIESQLATTPESQGADRLIEALDKSVRQKRAQRLNPIFQKVPLLNPEPLLRRAAPLLSWVFSAPMFAVWILMVACGCYSIVASGYRFWSETGTVFSNDNWIWLAVTWLALKLVHESSHALACKRFGGTVREAGVMFVLFAPLPFVDVTSSWRFDSKWQRIATSAAGMYAELFLAAAAALVWSATDNPLVAQHARNVVVTASFVTFLFNANPLMRFDGYYILCDWLELPNLATHGRQYMSYLGRRYLLGMSGERCPGWPEGRGLWVATYAVSATMWRIIISMLLVLAAEALFFGAGIVLAAAAVVSWVGVPFWRFVRLLAQPQKVNYRRFAFITASAAAVTWVLWFYVPWYSQVTAPAIVDYEPLIEVRLSVSGFVREVAVEPGDTVRAGQLLARFENPELALEVERLQIAMAQSRGRARMFRHAREIPAVEVEEENLRALGKRCVELKQQLEHLEVRSPVDGVVTHSDLQSSIGAFVQAGGRIVTIGARDSLRVHALVRQVETEAFLSPPPQQVALHIWGDGRRKMTAEVEKIRPRATTRLDYAALAAPGGGPLAVRQKPTGQDNADSGWELIDAHVRVVARCDGAEGRRLRAGQTGLVRVRFCRGTLGDVVWDTLESAIDRYRRRAAGT